MSENYLQYYTTLDIRVCIKSIMMLPQEYECEYGTSLWYKAMVISDTRLHITFTGGQFRRIKRSQYWIDFDAEGEYTIVKVTFIKDLLGFPSLTSIGDLDLFMKQKINALRR